MRVSVVIVTYGQWALTERCLRSLESALADRIGRDWEIVIVDNNSADETPARLRDWSDRVRVELLTENRNFAGGCNRGAALSTGKVLLFLNNDTEVPTGALELLADQALEPGVAAAGCRLLFADGSIQHAGVAFLRNPHLGDVPMPQHVFHHQSAEIAATQAVFETDSVTAACMAVRREAFVAVGGFDERYRNGLEDIDLCLRLRTEGHTIVYRGDITILHHEGGSRGSGPELFATQEKLATAAANDRLFIARWSPYLEQDDELAAAVWDGELRFGGPARTSTPRDGAITVVGQPFGLGPAADEARALIAAAAAVGRASVAVNSPPALVTGRVTDEMRALLEAAERQAHAAGQPVVYVPTGPQDALVLPALERPAVVRLARPDTAIDLNAADEVWVTAPGVLSELVRRGLPEARIRVVPSPVADRPIAAGGEGILVILPVHDPALCGVVLDAIRDLPVDMHVRLLPTAYRRGLETALEQHLDRAVLLPPCTDESAFAALAGSADMLLAADPTDTFERRALVAASVGTAPLTLAPTGQAAALLGPSAAVDPTELRTALVARVHESPPRQTVRERVLAGSALGREALRDLHPEAGSARRRAGASRTAFESKTCPVFITCRDRVTDLRQLVAWLEASGHERIVLLDNDSRWQPMLDYLDASPHDVRRLGQNYGSRALWAAGMLPVAEWFVLTDPDVIPTADCPPDAIDHLHSILERYPSLPKAGLGLYLDDLPASFDQSWERSLCDESRQLEPGVFNSEIDTTFALYRPGTPFGFQAIRTDAPYVARHMGWYAEAQPTEEDLFYLSRAASGPTGSSWLARVIQQQQPQG